MKGFMSDELKTINKALDFYKYQMNKTTNMDEYRTWKSTQKKFNERLDYRHGVWSWRVAE